MSKRKDIAIFVLDNIVVSLVIGPLVVMYWRGTWVLFGHYVYPDNTEISGWIGGVIGNFGLVLATLLQWILKSRCDPNRTLIWIIVYHLYIYVFGFASVCHWYGAWTLLDVYVGRDSAANWVVIGVTGVFLLALRCFKTLVAPPIIVAVDTDDIFFVHTTRFRTTPENWENHFWDSILTVVFIGNLISSFWHSLRAVLDNGVYPDDDVKAAWTTVGFSYAGLLLCCLLQLIGNKLYCFFKKLKTRLLAVIIEDIVFSIGVFSAISHWKAFWMICDIYILPGNTVTSGWVCHAVGMAILMLILSGESTIVRGCFLDGEDSETGCIFPNSYIRFLLDKYKRKHNAIKVKPASPANHLELESVNNLQESKEAPVIKVDKHQPRAVIMRKVRKPTTRKLLVQNIPTLAEVEPSRV